MSPTKFQALALAIALSAGPAACKKATETVSPAPSPEPTESPRYLYLAASGVSAGTGCYGGGVTTLGASAPNTISRYNLDTGAFDSLVADYSGAGDQPIGLLDYDDDRILVLIENTGGRRLDLVEKSRTTAVSYYQNGSALTGVMRAIFPTADGSYLVSKSTAIEKIIPPNVRITVGGNPYVNAPAAPCATSTTLITSMLELSNGKILYAHAAVSPNNKIGMIAAAGYSIAADCLTTQAAPIATSLPTSMLVHSSGKLLVAYGSATATSNAIYAYDLDATANTITLPVNAYSTNTVVNGPSAMVEDRKTGDIYIANATSTYNTVERFTFNSTTKVLSRVGTVPFITSSVFTRCPSAMVISN